MRARQRRVPLGLLLCWLAAPAQAGELVVGANSSIELSSSQLLLDCSDLTVEGSFDGGSRGMLKGGDLTILPGGSVDPGDFVFEVNGDWTNGGSFNAGAGSVLMKNECGASLAVVTGDTTFNNLEISTTTTRDIQFQPDMTVTVLNDFLALGSAAGALLQFNTSLAGGGLFEAFWDLQGSQLIDYATFENIKAFDAPIAPGGSVQTLEGTDGIFLPGAGEMITIGDPGNAPDSTGLGAVADNYRIGRTEISADQYAAFLNAVARDDPNGTYDPAMIGSPIADAIAQTGLPGSYFYFVDPLLADQPATFVSFYSALRFANWLHNGQAVGAQGPTTTEDGAYTLLGSNPPGVTRNAGADFALPNEDEWYKAAYQDPGVGYYDYPAGSDIVLDCVLPGADTGNAANCWPATSPAGALIDVGSYALSLSAWGTQDQAGNVMEWTEVIDITGLQRGTLGGSWAEAASVAAATFGTEDFTPDTSTDFIGFRVVPEPGPGMLHAAGLWMLIILARHRRRAC